MASASAQSSVPSLVSIVDDPPIGSASKRCAIFAAIVGLTVSLIVLYPGQYSYDSAYQLWQARTGMFSNITPVTMIALWSMLLKVFGNPSSLFCLNLIIFWGGICLCFEAMRTRPWLTLLGILVTGLNPLALVQMSHLLSDAHMTAVLFLAVGVIAQSLRSPSRFLIGLGCVLAIYAGTIRQNALIAIVPLAPLVLCAIRSPNRFNIRWIFAAMIAAGVLTSTITAVMDRTIATERRSLWPMLALWDLAAISVETGDLVMPEFTHGAELRVEELRETGAFNPVSATYLFSYSRSGINSGLEAPYSSEREWKLAQAWWFAVLDHPMAYLKHRARTTQLLIGRHQGTGSGVPYFRSRTSYMDNPPLPDAWSASAQNRLYDLARQLSPTWFFSAIPYLLIHLLTLALSWRVRKESAAAMALGISASALLYSASFIVLAPSAELRYLTWPLISAIPALLFSLSARSESQSIAASPASAGNIGQRDSADVT